MMRSGPTEKKWNLFGKQEGISGQVQTDVDSKGVFAKIWNAIRIVCMALWHLRAVFMAIPVAIAALRLAAYNSEHLPLLVGIDLQTTGEFARTISRQTAVNVPLMITAACLGLMALSRKNLYPWLISVFSLIIPIFLLFINTYPA